MFRGVCCDPGWGPNSIGALAPFRFAEMGIRRVRIISKPGLDWFIDGCWAHNIYVRAVVVDGYYCRADEYVVGNEPNINDKSPEDFAAELQIHRNDHPERILIAGGISDAMPDIDGADYLRRVAAAGGLRGYQGVSIHYPASAARMTAFKRYSYGLPVHVGEYNPDDDLGGYLANVIRPHARTADYFCINDGMQDSGWPKMMGLYTADWKPKPVLRYWLSLT